MGKYGSCPLPLNEMTSSFSSDKISLVFLSTYTFRVIRFSFFQIMVYFRFFSVTFEVVEYSDL